MIGVIDRPLKGGFTRGYFRTERYAQEGAGIYGWIGALEPSSAILMSPSRSRMDRWGPWLSTSSTVHRMKSKPDYLKAWMHFLRLMLKTDRHNSEKSRYAAQLFVNYLLVSHAGLTPRGGEGRCRKRVRIRGRRRGLLIPRGGSGAD